MTLADPLVTPQRCRPGVVTDPAQVAAIRARMAYARLSWYRRMFLPRPPGWGRTRRADTRVALHPTNQEN